MESNNWISNNHRWATDNLNIYQVTVVREAGNDPLSGIYVERKEEVLILHASSRQEAYQKSLFMSTLIFKGQLKRTFIDGEEHFDEES